jgi:hypothetical protein
LWQLNWHCLFPFSSPVPHLLQSISSHHRVVSYFFTWRQDKLAVSVLSSGKASSRRLPSRAKIKALNLHHRHHPPSLNCPSFTIHCYKNIISTLITLPTTQLYLYFASLLAIASRHQSSTCCRHSLSLPFYIYRPSV